MLVVPTSRRIKLLSKGQKKKKTMSDGNLTYAIGDPVKKFYKSNNINLFI